MNMKKVSVYNFTIIFRLARTKGKERSYITV